MEFIHARLEMLLGEHDAYLDAICYCPHHPEAGWPGERPELKIDCECRKPRPGLILQAAADLNIDLDCSVFIGDSWRDTEAAKNAGLRSILVTKNLGLTVGDLTGLDL
jgi:D-glycero-D-manno-heptose 1,7-bisphosphate phosphatase